MNRERSFGRRKGRREREESYWVGEIFFFPFSFLFLFFFGGRTSQWKVIGCKWEGEGGYWVLDKWVNKWILLG